MREVVDLNRNYLMIAGQGLFLTVVGMNDRFDVTTCIVITMITHFVWISVFVWTGTKDTMSKQDL